MQIEAMERKKTGVNEVNPHKIASKAEWLVARKDLLEREKELTHLRDEISRHRRELPWVKIEKEYVFDAPEGKVTLADLFDGRSQLFIKHFMMGPGAAHQCVGCSLEVDHVEGLLEHLENNDVTYVVVARAPIDEIEVVRGVHSTLTGETPQISSAYCRMVRSLENLAMPATFRMDFLVHVDSSR